MEIVDSIEKERETIDSVSCRVRMKRCFAFKIFQTKAVSQFMGYILKRLHAKGATVGFSINVGSEIHPSFPGPQCILRGTDYPKIHFVLLMTGLFLKEIYTSISIEFQLTRLSNVTTVRL